MSSPRKGEFEQAGHLLGEDGVDRRQFLKMAGAFGALAALSAMYGCAQPAAAPAKLKEVLKVKYGNLIRNQGPLVLNLLKTGPKYGLEWEIVDFPDSVAIMTALGAGAVDIGGTTTQHLIRNIDEGLGHVAVTGTGGGYICFTVRADLPVSYGDWAGLKRLVDEGKRQGKLLKMAAPTGSYQHLALTWQLKKNGIDPAKDVEIISVPFPEHAKLLELKQVDMVSAVTLFAGFALMGGHGKVFYYPYDSPAGKTTPINIVRGKMVKEDPDRVQRMVSSAAEALKTVMDNPDKVLGWEKEYGGAPDKALEHHVAITGWNYRMDLGDIKGMAKMMYEAGWTKTDLSGEVEKHVDFRFLEKATGLKKSDLDRWDWKPKM